MKLARALHALSVTLLLCLNSLPAHATPEVGTWWNPDESGRGFVIDILDGNVLLLSSYLYADDGRATWLTSAGVMTDPDNYSGRLLAVSQGQTLVGDYHAPAPAVDIGAVSLHFVDSSHGTVTWPGGSFNIERFRFDDTLAEAQPYTGVWWNPDQSGRGFTVEVQGNHLVMAGFMYDGSGNPLWYLSAGELASPTQYRGALMQFGGGQSLTGLYRPPSSSVAAGEITIDFTTPHQANVTLSDVPPAAAGASRPGLKKEVSFPIQSFRSPSQPASLPTTWAGNFSFTSQRSSEDSDATINSTLVVQGNLTWAERSDIPAGDDGKFYFATTGSIRITYTYTLASEAGGCTGVADKTFAVDPDTNAGAVALDLYGRYEGQMSPQLVYPTTYTCDLDGEHTVNTADDALAMNLELKGVSVFRSLAGKRSPFKSDEETTVSAMWNFVAPQ